MNKILSNQIKDVEFLKKMYIKFNNVLNKTLICINPIFYSKRVYRKTFGKKLNLKNPVEFNEKLMWLKFNTYYNNDLITQCADKYRVRDYVEKCGCEEILNGLIGVYNNVNEIEWNSLPNKFAIKCNHGAGYNIICTDKNKLDEKQVKKQLSEWMKEDYSKIAAEMQYKNINRKIICEKYIDMGNNKLPTDYKLYCFNGKVKIILVMKDRESIVTREFYNEKWERVYLREYEGSPAQPTSKPDNLEKMIEYAEKLSKPFEFVRVDLYDVNQKIIFGELTFTPTGCLAKYKSDVSKEMGSWINIEKEGKDI